MATTALPRPKSYDDTFFKPISLWLTTTDHKLIGIMYMVTSLISFVIGGIFALIIRLQLSQPNLTHRRRRDLQPADLGARRDDDLLLRHDLRHRDRELHGADHDRRPRHGLPAREPARVLAGPGLDHPLLLRLLHRRLARRRMDRLRAADREGVPGPQPRRRLLGDEHHRLGDQRDHGLDQLPDHDRRPARAGHALLAAPALRVGADLDLDPAARRGRAACRGDDPARVRPPARNAVLHHGGPAGAVPAPVLVLRAPRGLHHDPARRSA